MGSTTPNLSLYEPSVGETGWGTAVNGNFTTLDNALVNPNPAVTNVLDLSGAGAGQIKFPATQNPSANVNTLDDYEEGTWTPSVGGSATYTRQNGTYTKVGNRVTVACDLLINAIGTGSSSVISGLPFTTTVFTNGVATGPVIWASATLPYITIFAAPSSSSTNILLYSISSAGTGISSGGSVMGNGTGIQFSLTYQVA